MPFDDPDPDLPSSPAGSRALTGGAIAAFIGILLLLLGPSPTPGVPLNPHQLAYAFLGIGILLLLIGFVARLLSRS